MNLFATARLALRRLTLDDAPFVLALVNAPGFLRFVGDRGVRSLDDARGYLSRGPLASYQRHGFGLYRVALHADDTPIGICGILKRETLDDADLGFALLPEHEGRGYATEAAAATLAHGREDLGLRRLAAITDPENAGSIRVLERVGFRFERRLRLGEEELNLYARDL